MPLAKYQKRTCTEETDSVPATMLTEMNQDDIANDPDLKSVLLPDVTNNAPHWKNQAFKTENTEFKGNLEEAPTKERFGHLISISKCSHG